MMRDSAVLLAFAGVMTLHMAVSFPIRPPSLDPRQSNDCVGSVYPFDSSCWSILDLNAYITNWNVTVPVCDDNPSCCQPNELWSRCFIRLATNGTDQNDCSQIANNQCASEPQYLSVNPSIYPEARYIIHNIYFINAFFNNWYTALPIATLDTLLVNQPLIVEIDPVQKTNFILGDILSALSAGLAFIGLPEFAPAVSATAKQAAQAILHGVQQSPGIAKTIWPAGTTDSQSVQLANLDSELGQVFQSFTQKIEDTLFLIMSDVPSFIAFASSGAFSGPDELSLPNNANATAEALRTFVLSTAMTGNHWHADITYSGMTKAQIEQVQLERGGAKCSFGANNICTDRDHSINIWYSDVTNRAYDLIVRREPSASGPNPFELMNDILSNEWSTLETLFDGSYNCTAAGNFGQRLNFTVDGSVDFSCMSQLSNCIERGHACPVALIDGACPFAYCMVLS